MASPWRAGGRVCSSRSRSFPRRGLIPPIPSARCVRRDGEAGRGPGSTPAVLRASGRAPPGLRAHLPLLRSLHPPFSSLLPSQVGSSVGPERGRARPPGTMSGSDTAPFLSQADDTDDTPAPGTPGFLGTPGNLKSKGPEVPDPEGLQRITGLSAGHSALIVAVLCYINLLNYMDRFTVAGTDFWEDVRGGEGSGGPHGGVTSRSPYESSSQASFPTSSSSSPSETAAPASSRRVSGGPSWARSSPFSFPTQVGAPCWRVWGLTDGRAGARARGRGGRDSSLASVLFSGTPTSMKEGVSLV